MPLSGKNGFSIVEVVVCAAIIAVVVTGVSSAWAFYLKLTGESTRLAQAALLMEEGGEALSYLRDKGWDANIGALTVGTTYYLVWNGTDFVTTTSQTAINNQFFRKVIFSSVMRDASANIAGAGTVDPDTRLATIGVYATSTAATPILEAQMLIHDVFAN